jgi:hypothetical protein
LGLFVFLGMIVVVFLLLLVLVFVIAVVCSVAILAQGLLVDVSCFPVLGRAWAFGPGLEQGGQGALAAPSLVPWFNRRSAVGAGR